MGETEQKNGKSYRECPDHAEIHGRAGTFVFSGTDVLCGEGGNSGHRGARDQEHQRADFLGDTDTRGCDQSEAVQDGKNHHKGNAGQRLLCGDRQAVAQNERGFFCVDAEIFPAKREAKAVVQDLRNRKGNACGLCQHGRKCRTGSAHVKRSDEDQVADDVGDAGNQHQKKRRSRITDAAEDTAAGVKKNDRENADAADADVAYRGRKSVFRRIHNGGERAGEDTDQHGEQKTDTEKQRKRGSDGACGFLLIFLSDQMADADGTSHGKPGDDAGDGLHRHTACGDSGNICRGGKLADDHQIDGSIQCLEQIGAEYGEHKKQKLLPYRPGCHVVIHKENLPNKK